MWSSIRCVPGGSAGRRNIALSSAAAHLRGQDDVLVKVAPLLGLIPDWQGFLNTGLNEDELARRRRHERTGQPLGDEPFLRRLEKRVGRVLRRLKPEPKPKREKK